MHRGTVIWAAGIGPLIVLDVVLDRHQTDSTLSAATRYVYRTETRFGRCAFLASWLALAAWFPRHILSVVEDKIEEQAAPATRKRPGA